MGCCASMASVKTEDKIQTTLPATTNIQDEHLRPKEKSANDPFIVLRSQIIKEYNSDPWQKYEKIKLLGEGFFGKVFLVKDKTTSDLRAMKILSKPPQLKLKPTIITFEDDSIEKEVEILRTLDHPNIVKLLEFYNGRDEFFIITEYIRGGELFDKIIKYKHINEAHAAKIMKQLLSAIHFCHKKKIIHRDIKPENILIEESSDCKDDEKFMIKLIDFGLAEVIKFQDKKLLKAQVGSPYYLSPEVVIKNEYNEKRDIWACGVVLYILLSGRPPFGGSNNWEIYAKIKLGKFFFTAPIWGEISSEAKTLITCMLETNVEKRLSAEECLNHSWFSKFKNPSQSIENPMMDTVLANLKAFHTELKLQQIVLYYIVHNLDKIEDIKAIRDTFYKLDENNDGSISKEELRATFSNLKYLHCNESEVKEIVERVDIDKNHTIEFEEFLTATIDAKKVINTKNLEKAFALFDEDGNGQITKEELKKILKLSPPSNPEQNGNNTQEVDVIGTAEAIEEKIWDALISNIDSNNDGKISFDEFKVMMEALTKT